MSETYNGWTNYETWCVNLWMDNGQGSQKFFRDTARQIHAETGAYGTGLKLRRVATVRFAEWLQDYYSQENWPELSGVYEDLLRSAFDAVNWDEIARHYIEAVLEEADNE